MRHPHHSLRERLGASLALFAGVALVGSMGSSCNLDPVHRAGVNNLGDEQPRSLPAGDRVPPAGRALRALSLVGGPGGQRSSSSRGTIFWGPDRYDRRVDKAYVRIGGPEKTTKCFVTNCNGNFYVTQRGLQEPQVPAARLGRAREQPGRPGPRRGEVDPLAPHVEPHRPRGLVRDVSHPRAPRLRLAGPDSHVRHGERGRRRQAADPGAVPERGAGRDPVPGGSP